MDDETRRYIDAVEDAIMDRINARFDAMEAKIEARLNAIDELLKRAWRITD